LIGIIASIEKVLQIRYLLSFCDISTNPAGFQNLPGLISLFRTFVAKEISLNYKMVFN